MLLRSAFVIVVKPNYRGYIIRTHGHRTVKNAIVVYCKVNPYRIKEKTYVRINIFSNHNFGYYYNNHLRI